MTFSLLAVSYKWWAHGLAVPQTVYMVIVLARLCHTRYCNANMFSIISMLAKLTTHGSMLSPHQSGRSLYLDCSRTPRYRPNADTFMHRQSARQHSCVILKHTTLCQTQFLIIAEKNAAHNTMPTHMASWLTHPAWSGGGGGTYMVRVTLKRSSPGICGSRPSGGTQAKSTNIMEPPASPTHLVVVA